jgi:hypothetical protein
MPGPPKRSSSRKRDDDGFKLPKVGVGQLFRELGGGLTGLARLALPGAAEDEPGWADFGKGVGSSLAGTALTVMGGSEKLPANRALSDFVAKNLGEEYRPQAFVSRAGERGILPALVEDVGNVAIAGGAATKAASVGRVGRAGAARAAADEAARLSATKPGSRQAANAARRAEKAATKRTGFRQPRAPRDFTGIDAPKVAQRAGTIERTRQLAHPYQSLYEGVLRPVTRAASEAQIAGAGRAASVADTPAPVEAPTFLGANAGPVEQTATVANRGDIPEWATQLAERLGPAQGPLAAVENRIKGREMKGVYNERRRFVEASRKAAMQTPAVKQAVDIARGLIEQTGAHRDVASEMVGSEIMARLTGLKAMADELPVAARSALWQEGGLGTPLPDALRTPELDAALDAAADAWRAEADTRRTVLESSRLGSKGLDQEGVKWTKREQREFKLFSKEMQDAAKLSRRGEREAARARKIADRAEGMAGRRDAEIADLQAKQGTAAQRFAESRGGEAAANGVKVVENEGEVAMMALEGLGDDISARGFGTLTVKFTDSEGGVDFEPFDDYSAAKRAATDLNDEWPQAEILRDVGESDTVSLLKATYEPQKSMRKQAQKAPDIDPEESGKQMYRRGVKSGTAIGDTEVIDQKIARKVEAKAKALKIRDDMQRALAESSLPSQVAAAAKRASAERRLDRLVTSLDNPSVARVPAEWQPLMGAVKSLEKIAEKDPYVAAALADVPKTFSEVMRFAAERGFEPAHVRSFLNKDIEHLVFSTVRLGKRGRELGMEVEAGTRKSRRNPFAKTQSIEALVAASVEVAHEANTNALVDVIESTYARGIPEDGVIPKGWKQWDPVRSFILTGEKVDNGVSLAEGFTASKPTKMVPEAILNTLKSYEKDYGHWAQKTVGRVTSPWRTFLLTLSPRWYVNNIIGASVLATSEGVRLQDWVKAWDSYRRGFNDVPGVTDAAIVSDIGSQSLIKRSRGVQGLKEAKAEGGVGSAASELAKRMRRANEVVDEFARAAVYHTNVRRGTSPETALQRALTAMVDYQDLTPFERQIVKSVVPFYSWSKGILKLVAKYPIDHPIGAAVAMNFGRLNEEWAAEAGLPSGYSGLTKVPGLGTVNLRSWQPFQDSAQLTTPEGIGSAVNPFVEAMVRDVLDAPSGFGGGQRINDYGIAVGDANTLEDSAKAFTELPQVRLAQTYASGDDRVPAGQATARFFGLPTYSEEQVRRIQRRVREQKKRL